MLAVPLMSVTTMPDWSIRPPSKRRSAFSCPRRHEKGPLTVPPVAPSHQNCATLTSPCVMVPVRSKEGTARRPSAVTDPCSVVTRAPSSSAPWSGTTLSSERVASGTANGALAELTTTFSRSTSRSTTRTGRPPPPPPPATESSSSDSSSVKFTAPVTPLAETLRGSSPPSSDGRWYANSRRSICTSAPSPSAVTPSSSIRRQALPPERSKATFTPASSAIRRARFRSASLTGGKPGARNMVPRSRAMRAEVSRTRRDI